MKYDENQHLVIFDGVCNFCCGAVNFIIKRDKANRFVFTPMQTGLAQELIKQHKIDNVGVDTFMLIKNQQCHVYSTAALEIAKDLTGGWFLFNLLRVIPFPIRDFFYKIFARNRYRLFGRKDFCMIPSAAIKSKFIDL